MVDSSRESLGDVSRPSAGDVVRAGIDTGLQLVPGGGLVLPFLQLLVATPLEKRRDAWIQDLADRVAELENGGQLLYSDLEDNEPFATAVYHGVRAAISTSAHEKHEALRNAALNSALQLQPENDLFEMFLRYLSDFTPVHIKLLMLYDDPGARLQERGLEVEPVIAVARWHLVELCLPELAGYKDTASQAWEELRDRGLVQATSLDIMGTAQGLESSLTSSLGKQFVAFISDPPRSRP
jgi:hypothetical protein